MKKIEERILKLEDRVQVIDRFMWLFLRLGGVALISLLIWVLSKLNFTGNIIKIIGGG